MPKNKMDKVSAGDRDDKPTLLAPMLLFATITVATVLAAVLINYAFRALLDWFAA